MKSLLFLTFLGINFSTYANIHHTCAPIKTNAEISKINVSYVQGANILSIFKFDGTVVEVEAQDYNDMTYIGFFSEVPPYNLIINQDTSGNPTDAALLEYGENFKQRLYFSCQ